MRKMISVFLALCLLAGIFAGDVQAAIAGDGQFGGGAGIPRRAGGPTTYGDDLSPQELAQIELMLMDSPPVPPAGEERPVVTVFKKSANLLPVPTSTWTYGCSATSAGMIFGYFDRNGWPNMYTGPTNNGVAPLTNLGQGISTPIAGSCSLIATKNGFDGRTTPGHVDDYWISTNSRGPDPWQGVRAEHVWEGCTADFMGTSQWKWDTDRNGVVEKCLDGVTCLYSPSSGMRLYDYVPPSAYGLPQTALCHGMRLFAESRGYTVLENYTQNIDALLPNGFTFADYKAEINNGWPVMIQVVGHSMVGVGYDDADNTVYLHDTWDNKVHSMKWGGSYAGMAHRAVTVIHLERPSSIEAQFNASPVNGFAPLNVQFADQSSGSPTAWYWDFGDGHTSTLQHPSHVYASPGSYSVSLTVTGASGSDTESKTGYITLAAAVIEISSLDALQRIGNDPGYPLDGDYILTQDIDASATAAWNGGAGFEPVGPFSGSFDGQGYVITNLTIYRPSEDLVGLFGTIDSGGVVENLGLVGGSVTGKNSVGGLAGYVYEGTISGCYGTSSITGEAHAGGLAGYNEAGSIVASCATGPVSGGTYLGGLAGTNDCGAITQCYATGPVAGTARSGGLVGNNTGGAISACYAAGTVSGPDADIGGLVGQNSGGVVECSFWDVETSGIAQSGSGTGLSTTQMETQSTFTGAGWDFNSIWYMLAGGSYPYLANLPPRIVPALTGLMEAEAATTLECSGFSARVSYAYSSTTPAGMVINQNPAAMTEGPLGSPVAFTVSLSEELVSIPNVAGQQRSVAELMLSVAGLAVGTVTQQYSNTVPAGQVISQSPAAGAQVAPGSAVNLVVSKGVQPVAVPNVVGKTEAAAASTLNGAGLAVGSVTQQYSNTVPAGQVISQSPAAGAQVAPGSAIDLVVSKGVQPVAVPNVVGKTEAAAESALTGAGLAVGSVTQQYSNTVPAGQVISQSPAAGAQVAPGSAVNLVVSKGVQPVAVPNVVGKTEAAAGSALTSAGLAVGAVTQQYSNTVPAGQVISQSPAAGAQVAPGSAVDLVVSKGVQPVAVPNVVGKTEAAAGSALTSAGLTVGSVTQQYSSTVPAGQVISQSPAAGAQVAPGSAVNLVVSKGVQPVSVPNVVGKTEAAAGSALTAAGLTVGSVIQQYSSTVPAGQVISQSPAAGAQVAPGSAVDLMVSKGVQPVAVPSVVGKTEAAAGSALTSAGLAVGSVTQQYSSTVPAGQVISQSPAAGAQVAPGSAIDLVVSKGVQPVAVPNVVGKTEAAAESALTGAGLAVGSVTQQYSNTVPAGQVISQSPAAGAQVAPGSAVDLVVSKGVQPVAVPNVVGKTEAAAGSALTSAGLTVGSVTQQYSSTVPAGQVISQSPAAGAQVAPGSAVDLVVSKGVQPVAVPNVVGKTESEATSAIVAAGLTVGRITWHYSNTTPPRMVVAQDPAPSTEVDPGSPINLTVTLRPRFGNLMVSISKLMLTFGAPSASFSISNPDGGVLDWQVESETDNITIQPASGSGAGSVTVTGMDFSNTENSRLIVKNLDDPGDVAYIQLVLARPGDINGDNIVNAMDVQLVVNAVLRSSSGLDCDINGDGLVNAIDVQLVVNNVLGL